MSRTKQTECGSCRLARSVRAGTAYGVQQDGKVTYLSEAEALEALARRCRCDLLGGQRPTPETTGRTEVRSIRRDGQRMLKAGANIKVQLKGRPGTAWSRGHVRRCFADGTVELFIDHLGDTVTCPVDQHLVGRRGSAK